MSSNVASSSIQHVLTSTHKKRPHHPSPIPSYRSVQRSGVVKRARWDVSSPTPSPPVLSLPLPSTTTPQKRFEFASSPAAFRFGFKSSSSSQLSSSPSSRMSGAPSPTSMGSGAHPRPKRHRPSTSSDSHSHSRGKSTFRSFGTPAIVTDNTDDLDDESGLDRLRTSATAFERLRRSTIDEGEVFVNRMQEWERSQAHSQWLHTAETTSVEASSASISSPYMSNSITSNSTTSSASGSEGPFFLRGGSTGRKRSWSIAEGEENHTQGCYEQSEMEWEVLLPEERHHSTIADLTTTASRGGIHIPMSRNPKDTPTEADIPDSVSSFTNDSENPEDQDGDDEQEDDDEDDDSDDDLIFVIGNPPAEVPQPGNIPNVVPPASTDRMVAELSQVLAAGAAGLYEAEVGLEMESEAFVDVDAGLSFPPTPHDAGALWQ
ncbi:hypothetical protein FRB99_000521 [Tulasnella sp. 403]|nr:hypothetical protein FRB99_000521 [Tulasnella sp. 403]